MNKPYILLVADDGLAAASSLQTRLQNLGYVVPITTGSGEEAVQLAATHQPDLIVMDMMLSGDTDGIVAASAIRQQVDVPIIYLTDHADETTMRRTKAPESFVYLLRPLNDQTLQTTIQISLYKHQMEKRLKESETFFRLLFDMASVGMVVTIPDGRFLCVNQAFCNLTGYKSDELIGRHFAEITHPDDIKKQLALEQQVLNGDQSSFRVEKRYTHKDGYIVYVMLHVTLLHNDGRQPQFFISQIMDITQWVKAETEKASLIASREHLLRMTQKARLTAETMQAANIALTQNLDLNNILETLLNYLAHLIPYDNAVVMLVASQGQLQIQAVRDLQPLPSQVHRKLVKAPPLIERVLRQQKSLIIADAHTHPDWEYRASSTHVRSWLAVPLIAGSRVIGLYSLAKQETNAFSEEHRQWAEALAAQAAMAIQNAKLYADVQAQMQELQEMHALIIQNEKMSALGRLMASLAHEINNPLQAVQGCLTLGIENLARGNKEAADTYLQIVQTEIDRVARIVQNLRDFYRVTTEKMQPTDLESTLDSVLQLAHKQLEHHNIIVERTAADLLPTLMANTNQLKQVFLNLILNAVDAMPDGGQLKLHTSLTTMAGANRTQAAPAVRLVFNNNGEIMDSSTLDHLFEPFFTTKEHGSGLGLSISYSIIEAHGGRIAVTSDEQAGTTFTIWLPI